MAWMIETLHSHHSSCLAENVPKFRETGKRTDLCSVQIAGLELSQDDFLAVVQKNPAGNEERLPSTYFTPPLDVITGL